MAAYSSLGSALPRRGGNHWLPRARAVKRIDTQRRAVFVAVCVVFNVFVVTQSICPRARRSRPSQSQRKGVAVRWPVAAVVYRRRRLGVAATGGIGGDGGNAERGLRARADWAHGAGPVPRPLARLSGNAGSR